MYKCLKRRQLNCRAPECTLLWRKEDDDDVSTAVVSFDSQQDELVSATRKKSGRCEDRGTAEPGLLERGAAEEEQGMDGKGPRGGGGKRRFCSEGGRIVEKHLAQRKIRFREA